MWQNSWAAYAAYLITASVRRLFFHPAISISFLPLQRKLATSCLIHVGNICLCTSSIFLHFIYLFIYLFIFLQSLIVKPIHMFWKLICSLLGFFGEDVSFLYGTSACPRAVKRQRISLNTPTASFLVLIWHEQRSSRARPSTAWRTEQWGLRSGSLGLDWWRGKQRGRRS